MNRYRISWLLSITFVIFIFGSILQTVSLTAVFHSLAQLQIQQILLLILLNGFVIIFVTARWWLILWRMGFRIPFWMAVGHRLASFGVSFFTPGPQFGGEPVQVLLAEKANGVPRVTAVSSVALDKTLELLINFTFILLGVLLILQWEMFTQAVRINALFFFGALLVFPALYLAALWRGKRPLSGFMRVFQPLFNLHSAWGLTYQRFTKGMGKSEAAASRFCRRAPQFLFLALGVSILGRAFLILEFFMMVNALGANLSLLEAIILLTAVRIAFLLPLPGGLGSVEAAMAFTLNLLGSNPAIALSASILIRSRDVSLGLLGLWWGAGGWKSWRRKRELGIGD